MTGLLASRSCVLAVAVAALGCGDVTCASHEVVHELNGRRVQISAQHRAGVGIGLAGAPHAFAIAYPTWEDSGIHISMTVDDRPPVMVGHESDGDLEEIAAAVEIAVSDDGLHVASRHGERWQVFHLLPKGTPFDAPGPETTGDAIDLSTYGTPEEIAIEVLEDEAHGHGAPFELLLRALGDQDPSPALDRALLHGWPGARHQSLVMSRLTHEATGDEFREATFERAKEVIAEHEALAVLTAEQQQNESALIEALVVLGPERVAWLDERMVAQWEAQEGDLPPRVFTYFSARRDERRPFANAEPMAEPLRARAAAAARRWLEAHHVSDGRFQSIAPTASAAWGVAIHYVAHEGTDEDERWLHDVLLASWPGAEESPQVHDTVVSVARGRLGAPTDAWERDALRAAERALGGERVRDATDLLLALDAPPASIDRAFDASIASGRGGIQLVRANTDRASPAWKRATVARARAAETPAGSDYEARASASALRELGFDLAVELEDCEAMNELAERHVQRERIPASCAPAAPPPPGGPTKAAPTKAP